MIYLTEEEFDRKYLVKRAVARTVLRQAAETDDNIKAYQLACDAAKMFSSLPKKEKCLVMRCEICGGFSLQTDVKYDRWCGQLVDVRHHTYCETCETPDPVFVERYEIFQGQL